MWSASVEEIGTHTHKMWYAFFNLNFSYLQITGPFRCVMKTNDKKVNTTNQDRGMGSNSLRVVAL